MQKIVPTLWFTDNAEEAAHYYIDVFGEGEIGRISRYDKESAAVSGRPEGSVLTVDFTIVGQRFIGLNGGPVFSFTPAVSFFVYCETPEEVDALWGKLIEGGTALMPLDTYPFSERYGWLQDKYGVSWQLHAGPVPGQKIAPGLLFVGSAFGKAEEAMTLYTSLLPDSRIGDIARYDEQDAPGSVGNVKYADFTLSGQHFVAMDSGMGHDFTFTPAISFLVNCETQEEIDALWYALSAVPEAEQCGWLQDTFGVSWQIVPRVLDDMIADPDPAKSQRAMKAMLRMKKLDIAELQKAYEGGE